MKRQITILILSICSAWLIANYEYEDPSTGDSGQNFARITYSDAGNQYITTEGNYEADVNQAVNSGVLLATEYRSFMEIELIDGTLVQINGNTKLEFQAINDVYNQESLTVINLDRGSLFFHITPSPEWLDHRVFRIDSSHGSVYLESPGLYRIDHKSYQMKLYVYRGIGELSGENESSLVRSGEYSAVSNFGYPNRAKAFNSYYKDSFTSWAYSRNPMPLGVSAQYVPIQLSRYSSSLDSAGSWRYNQGLGTHVWAPTVATNWRPYNDGYWNNSGPSLSWVGRHNWSWVTGHYGRWGWDLSFGWYWIPDRFYAPAWVAWTVLDGLLGWCPLGRWNSPFYYNRHHSYNTVIVNNYHNRWTYRSPDRIHVRDYRTPGRAVLKPRTVTKYTSRAIRVDANRRSNPSEYTRAVLKPRSANRTTVQSNVKTRTFDSRSSNTRATSRYKSDPVKRTYDRVKSSSTRSTQVDRTTRTTRSTDATSPRSTSTRSQSATRTTPKTTRTTDRVTSSPTRTSSPSRSTTSRTTRSSESSTTRRSSVDSPKAPSRQRTSEAKSSSTGSTYRVPSRTSSSKAKPTSSKSSRSSSVAPSRGSSSSSSKPSKSTTTKPTKSTTSKATRSSSTTSRTYRTPAKSKSLSQPSYRRPTQSYSSSKPSSTRATSSRSSTRTQSSTSKPSVTRSSSSSSRSKATRTSTTRSTPSRSSTTSSTSRTRTK